MRPVAGLEGSVVGTAWISASPFAPGWAGETRAMPGSRRATADTAAASRCGATIWSAPGAPAPKACCTWV